MFLFYPGFRDDNVCNNICAAFSPESNQHILQVHI